MLLLGVSTKTVKTKALYVSTWAHQVQVLPSGMGPEFSFGMEVCNCEHFSVLKAVLFSMCEFELGECLETVSGSSE